MEEQPLKPITMDWIVSPKISSWSLNLQCDGIEDGTFHLDGAMRVGPHNGISDLISRGRDTTALYATWAHNKR